MTTQMIVRLDSDTKSMLTMLAQAEGKNTSQVVRELIEDYIQDRDMGAYIDDLWSRVGKKLKSHRVDIGDVEQAIRDVRAAKK
ncbi:MAG: ribbon-helix-helix protein, CopG family [bacterium]